MRHQKWHFPSNRPEWWPKNETWPPERGRWRRQGRRFFMGIGCLFFVILLGISSLLAFFFLLMAQFLGLFQIPSSLAWAIPVGLVILIIGLAFLGLGVRALRRISRPFDDLLAASERIANGDYSTRVAVQGPREMRSLVHAFNSMAARLQISDEQRRSLLADVTHELRTPITVIQGNLEGMLDGVYPADPEHLESILNETRLLSRLVDDLRTLALAESGALQLIKEPTDLGLLLVETTTSYQPQAAADGITLSVEIDANLPLLELDPVRMREVFSNLITNSIRYTPSGGSIQVKASLSGMDVPNQIVVSVEDTGVGISNQDLEHIFDRFYKGRSSGGMGLGLSIAKHLVDAHGGIITAKSELGRGTSICISLPVRE
jgi:signal transduction histidine kinase